jgi:hypothetical protein
LNVADGLEELLVAIFKVYAVKRVGNQPTRLSSQKTWDFANIIVKTSCSEVVSIGYEIPKNSSWLY